MLDEINIPIWYSNGSGMKYRRDCLPEDHLEHMYNYIKRVYGVDPKLYGINNPMVGVNVCPHCNKDLSKEKNYESCINDKTYCGDCMLDEFNCSYYKKRVFS